MRWQEKVSIQGFRISTYFWKEERVFDSDGNVVYEPSMTALVEKVPFLVKVEIPDLNIRKGPGTSFDRVKFIPPGVYTIVEMKQGNGSEKGWGKLKSGLGWISLTYVGRI